MTHSSLSLLTAKFLGEIPYQEALQLQSQRVELLKNSLIERGVIFGLEHRAVVTLGKRGRLDLDLQVSRDELEAKCVEFFLSPRGGQATFHSPGQLVIYPCLRLGDYFGGIKNYVTHIQEATRLCLAEFGIESWLGADEPGLYTPLGKIGFFGVRVDRGVVSHGLAINVRNDLKLFNLIRSCGKSDERFAKISDFGVLKSPEEVFSRWVPHFLSRIT